jgi:AraC-like DNA-binding protein
MASPRRSASESAVTVHRHASLPGIELVTQHPSQSVTLYCTDFALIVPDDWEGVVLYQRRCHALGPGRVLCIGPGELLATPQVCRSGRLRVLLVATEIFNAALLASGIETGPGKQPATAPLSCALARRLESAFRMLEAPLASGELPELFEALLTTLGKELFRAKGDAQERLWRAAFAGSKVDQLHESLVRQMSAAVAPPDMTALAQKSGLSRFQALRLFRRHYGITPYAYQLHFRIAHARRCLRGGANPAEVAANFGFADQSHFTRHFKRLVGVTPGQYARSR